MICGWCDFEYGFQICMSLKEIGNPIRYVGVIWFLFHVLQLLPIRCTQQNSCCISKSTMKNMQKPG